MKRLITVFVFLGALLSLQAQFVEFGTDYDIQRGDFAVADIDSDGDLDIIFSGENNGDPLLEKGAILINEGSGNFTPQEGERVIRIGKSGNIHFGDIDGDGDLDVIFAGWHATNITHPAGIALNNGAGIYTLAAEELYPVNPAATVTSCGFADFNLDGLLDYYFFANGEGNCIIYFRQTAGNFEASTESFGNCSLVEPEVTVIDFDNDHYPDIFITAYDNITATRFSALFKNDGFGAFTQYAGVDIYRKKANGTASWGDLNGDGYPDLLLNGDGWLDSGEDSDGIVRIYKNENGTSTAVAQAYEFYRQNGIGNGSAIVDWDNDGDLDFFLGGWNGTKQETALYLCDDPATFSFTKSPLSDTYFPGISEQGFRIADLDGDNKVDLLICGYSGGTLNLNRRIAGYVLNQSTTASTPPAAPTNLNAVVDNSDGLMVTFSWNAPASEAGKSGTTYNLALKNTTTGKWLYNPMAVIGGEKDGWRKVAGRAGNVFYNTRYELYDLPAGNYEWTVQAINGAYLGGAFAGTQTFNITGAGINNATGYTPKVYTSGKNLVIKGSAADLQSLKIYSVCGVSLVSTTFTGNKEIELPTGVYLVELAKAGTAPFRTKALITNN
jgi:hypothetical protein